MKNYFLTIVLLMSSMISFSQITVTDVNLLSIGDVIYLSEDDISSINIGNSGQNQNWDFSSLQEVDSYTLNVISPSGTPFDQSYPSANICIEDSGDFIYCDKSSSGVSMLGIGDSVFQQAMMICPLPLTYGASYVEGPILVLDSLIGGPMVNILLSSQGLSPAMITMGMAHTADSISIQGEMTTTFNVDADGNITIPMGTYDAVRLRIERISDIDVSVYCTDTVTGMFSDWYSLPFSSVDTEWQCQWYSNDPSTKFTLLSMIIDSLGNQDGSIEFLSTSTSANHEMEFNNFEVYPIPSTYKVTINSSNNHQVIGVLTDINGRAVLNFEFINSKDVDLSHLNKGIYLLNLTTQKESLIKKIIIE